MFGYPFWLHFGLAPETPGHPSLLKQDYLLPTGNGFEWVCGIFVNVGLESFVLCE